MTTTVFIVDDHCTTSSLPVSIPLPITAISLDRAVRIYFPCTGLGSQRRGFETFTIDCAAALEKDARLELTVFAGGKIREIPVRVLWNFRRDSRAARWLAYCHGRGTYFSEQLTFFLAFLPHLVRGRPDVVYFADINLGNLCWHWRKLSGQRFRLVFYNGGLATTPFTRADLVQQLTPAGLAEATARGEDPARQVVLPHGVDVPRHLAPPIAGGARIALGLPADRQVVLSVGLLDAEIKRMDYLIREVAALPEPRPFLCLLGAESPETPAIRALARELLGEGNVLMGTVSREQIRNYYRAADVFVLASLREGFGLVYVEALAHGLLVVAHDTAVTRYLLDGVAALVDLSVVGNASGAIAAALATPGGESARHARHAVAHSRFGWDVLRERYVAMFLRAAGRQRTSTVHA